MAQLFYGLTSISFYLITQHTRCPKYTISTTVSTSYPVKEAIMFNYTSNFDESKTSQSGIRFSCTYIDAKYELHSYEIINNPLPLLSLYVLPELSSWGIASPSLPAPRVIPWCPHSTRFFNARSAIAQEISAISMSETRPTAQHFRFLPNHQYPKPNKIDIT